MSASITGFTAGILALVYLGLIFWVIHGRFKYRVSLGEDGNPALRRRVRAHANFAEYVPIGLILMLLVETGGGARWVPQAMGVLLVAGRLLHLYGVGVLEKPGLPRMFGMIATNTTLLIGAVVLIGRALG